MAAAAGESPTLAPGKDYDSRGDKTLKDASLFGRDFGSERFRTERPLEIARK